MFYGLDGAELAALLSFAGGTVAGMVGIFVRVGRVLEKIQSYEKRTHDHERRIRRAELRLGLPPMPLEENGRVVTR